jgi:hypothetical protein
MAKNKGNGKKKGKGKKVNDVLEQILASMETMSLRLVKLEEKFDSLRPEPERQGVRGHKGDSEPGRSTGSGGGRGHPVTKKKTTRKKSITGKVVGNKAITKKAVARKVPARKKAATRNVTRKKTVTRPRATKKAASRKTPAERR